MVTGVSEWVEVYDDLRAKIKQGELRAEAEISIADVASGVSEVAFRRAIEQLTGEGVLTGVEGGEIKVALARARSRRSARFREDYANQGRAPTIRTLKMELLPIEDGPKFVQDSLSTGDCSMLVRHYHVQSVDGIPHALADSYYPYELIGKQWRGIRAGEVDIWDALSGGGLHATEKEETLYVDSPTLAERLDLGIEKMPALQVVRLNCVMRSPAEIIEVCLLCDRADLYEFSYKITI